MKQTCQNYQARSYPDLIRSLAPEYPRLLERNAFSGGRFLEEATRPPRLWYTLSLHGGQAAHLTGSSSQWTHLLPLQFIFVQINGSRMALPCSSALGMRRQEQCNSSCICCRTIIREHKLRGGKGGGVRILKKALN